MATRMRASPSVALFFAAALPLALGQHTEQAPAWHAERGMPAVAARPEMMELRHKAKELQSEFMDLSSDALSLQCQQFEKARSRGQQKWMEEQGFFEGLEDICAALKEKDPEEFSRAAHQEKRKVAEVATNMKKDLAKNTAGKSLAFGCTALLKAKNNGKMEWFESQSWYKKAMQMCTSLSGKSPVELEKDMQAKKGQVMHKMTLRPGHMLLKDSCEKLSKTPEDHEVRTKSWFKEAERMCSTVQTASQDELKGLISRQKLHAETASGQLIKTTCKKITQEKKMGGMKRFESEPWYRAMFAMCSKFNPMKVGNGMLARRCGWLKGIKKMGSDKTKKFESKAWYQHLETTCSFLESKKKKQGDQYDYAFTPTTGVPPVRERHHADVMHKKSGAESAAVFV